MNSERCPKCGHPMNCHDPEDGTCDHVAANPLAGVCRCGRQTVAERAARRIVAAVLYAIDGGIDISPQELADFLATCAPKSTKLRAMERCVLNDTGLREAVEALEYAKRWAADDGYSGPTVQLKCRTALAKLTGDKP